MLTFSVCFCFYSRFAIVNTRYSVLSRDTKFPLSFLFLTLEPTDIAIRLETVAKSNEFLIRVLGVGGNSNSLSFFSRNVLSSTPFLDGVENTYSQFFENCLTNLIIVSGLWSKYYRFTNCAAWTEVAAQLILHFPDGKCVTWKNKKKTLNMSDVIQSIFIKFSPKWSHYVWHYNSFNRWSWKCRLRSTFTKKCPFWHENISKILPTSKPADSNVL